MSDDLPTFERRFEQLAAEVQALSARVDELALRLAGAESFVTQYAEPHSSLEDDAVPQRGPADWTGATVLAGAAAVCFLLVFALILRTLVDNRVIDQPIGAVAGLIYASLILVYGYYRAHAKRRFASLSTTCGAVLILAIVVETHFRFGLLSADAAYAVIAATLCVMLAAGLRYGAYGAFDIAVPGVSVVAIGIDFPDSDFVRVGAVLAVAMAAAYAASSDARTRWLAYFMLAVSAFFWMWWTIKLHVPLSRGEPLDPSLRANWYQACLAVFVLLYTGQAIIAALSARRTMGVFECAAPLLASSAAYLLARDIGAAGGNAPHVVGWTGLGGAIVYAALSVWFAPRNAKGKTAATWFMVASIVLLALSVPDMFTNALLPIFVWTAASLVVTICARRRLGGAVPIAAILLQVYGCVYALWNGVFDVVSPQPFVSAAALTMLSIGTVFHYSWLQRNADPKAAHPAVLPQQARLITITVFFAGLIYAFCSGRIVLYNALVYLLDDAGYAFECGQSVLINLGALILGVIALKWMRNDLLASAVVVALIGATKVFAYDLLRTQGVPLVISVFAFGVTATAGSLIWNRWQRAAAPEEPASVNPAD